MSLALRRFRLDSIGPPGARFDPLVVDLAAADGNRAAGTSVLFLENGGGKSVLLRLLFSVVLPGRRYTVGSVKLDGYVGSGDTGHVVLDWETADGSLVTGTLFEWRNRTRSSSSSNLQQLWYSFRPRPGVLTLDDLPTRDGDRRVSRAGFRERLNALAREHPELELVLEDSPTKWADHLLRSTPVDPEIFRYQRQMNADEADAESLFAGLKTDDDFVRFVVEAVQDPEQFDGFGDLLVEYATHLENREEREVEARFCAAATAVLRPLGDAYEELVRTRREEAAARRAADRLRGRLATGAEQAEASAETFRGASETAAERVRNLSTEADRLAGTVAVLRLREAEFHYNEAKQAEDEAQAEAHQATLAAAAWERVGAVIDVRRLAAELEELRAAQERQEHELAPLRQEMEDAAARYARRLLAEAETLDAEAAAVEEAASRAEEQAKDMAARRDKSQHEAGEAAAEARGLRGRIKDVEKAVAAARSKGLLRAAESVDEAHLRARDESDAAVSALEQLRARRRAVEEGRSTRLDRLNAARGEEIRLDTQLEVITEELNGHKAAAGKLIAHPRVRSIVPDAEDAWLVADRLEEVLDESVRTGEASERSLRQQVQQLEERLEQLGADGRLPAAPDVVTVWDAIVAAGITATTGWGYLDRDLDADGRADALATNPALAGGVIVTDPDMIDKAQGAVVDAGVETESVVLIGTAAELEQPGAGRAAPVRRALYDRSWTARVRQELEAERAENLETLDAVTSRLGVDTPLLGEVRELRRRCTIDRRDQLVAEAARLAELLADVQDTVTKLSEDVRAAEEELASLQTDEPEALDKVESTREACRQLGELRADEGRSETWAQHADEADERHARLASETRKLGVAADEARDQAERHRATCRRAADEAGGLRREAGQLGVDPAMLPSLHAPPETVNADSPPETVSTESLQGAYNAAKEVYESERAGRDLTEKIEQVEDRHSLRTQELADLAPETLQEARTLASSPGADDPARRQARLTAAREDARRAAERLSRLTRELGGLENTLRERRNRAKLRHVTLDDLEPPDARSAALAAMEHQNREMDLRQEAREASEAAAHRAREAQEAEARAGLLRATLEVLPPPLGAPGQEDEGVDGAGTEVTDEPAELEEAPTPGTPTPWDGSTEQASEEASTLRDRHMEASDAVAQAERHLDRAHGEVRRVAADPSLAKVGGIRLALANEDRNHLAGRALELADEVDGMRQSIEEELADALRHREGIVQRLATLVESQLRQLKLLTRLSTLPSGLGDWSGKPFVSVDFTQVSAGELTARLGPIVDEAAAEPRKRGALDLVLAGMRAAVLHRQGDVEKTFTVRLLRPNRMMSHQRASVGELEGEFSGGMKLTAAICTYCALAALRANCRSTGSLFGVDPGPLFLDNPLGKASADYLLELQHAIAEKLGVQLIHTTGVWDVEALATYERVVRLRNLADVRRNVSRLRVDDDVQLPGSGATVDAVGFAMKRR